MAASGDALQRQQRPCDITVGIPTATLGATDSPYGTEGFQAHLQSFWVKQDTF